MLANMNLNIQKFWRKRSVTITEYDPTYKVIYLGNVLTGWAKGDGCVDKPLATIWKNYCQSTKPEVGMKVTVCGSGLKAVTKEHGLTEYWSHRITFCGSHPRYPRVFCWVYRHEGKRLKQELRCHAVLCTKEDAARAMSSQLQHKLRLALQEFRREKLSRQNARLSLANSVYDNPSLPRRKILLCTGTANYRPPLERSRSAPKLTAIEEGIEEEYEEPEEGIVLEEDEELDEQCRLLLDDLALGSESNSDVADSDSDKFLFSDSLYVDNENHRNNTRDLLLEDVVVDLPGGRVLSTSSDEGDNISDESGYSEENQEKDFTCKM